MPLAAVLFIIIPQVLCAMALAFFLVGALISTSPRLRLLGFAVMLIPSLGSLGAAVGAVAFTSAAAIFQLRDVAFTVVWALGAATGGGVGLLLGAAASWFLWRKSGRSER